MNSGTSVTNIDVDERVVALGNRSPSWGAIFAGATAGMAVHFLLLMLGTATGLGAAEPATDDNPIASFGIGAGIVWTISALISLWVGGWVAGRYAARTSRGTGRVHGFLVWCVATIAGLLLVVTGGGAIVGGAARIVGQGFSALGKPVAGVADMAKQAVEQNVASLNSMVEEVIENQKASGGGAGAAAVRREVGQALRQLFREGGNLRDPQSRAAVIQALTQSAGMNETQATEMVDRWTESMERMRAQFEQAKTTAEAKAREAADKASRALSRAALWTFIGFVLGAIAASWGGKSGADWEYRHNEGGREPSLGHTRRGPMPGHA
jgi:hypothetical protein